MSVKIGELELKNPIMPASGTFGYGEEFEGYFALERLGALVTKGISLYPRGGNPPPRIVETPSGMLNSIGLDNVGSESFIKEKLPFLRNLSIPVVVNFFGESLQEYVQLARNLCSHSGIAALEMNISCPNVEKGGLEFGRDPRVTYKVVKAVRREVDIPLWVKLTPNVTDIVAMAKAAEEAGADALSLINTLTGMAINIRERRPMLGNITGGLSGPAIKPVALRMVWQVASGVSIPVIGVGGITRAEDVVEFMIAGACATQVGTANFISPEIMSEIIDDLTPLLKDLGVEDIKELIGSLNV